MLTFAHNWMFWLAPLPLLVRWLVPPLAQSIPAVRVPFLSRLRSAGGAVGNHSPKADVSLFVQGFVWLLLLTALARPQWLEPPIERSIPTRDLLLVVDLSGSMDHEDFTNVSGDQVNRLEAVKEVLGDFLIQRKGDRVGLVVFGNSPFLQVPFTTDLELCRQLLDEAAVGMAGPRTALGDAIGLGIQLLENSDTPDRTMIVLTDGNDTASAVPPEEAAQVAKDRDITIHTIAIGDPTTVGEENLDEQALRDVAETTQGGKFFLALNREELSGVYSQLDKIETRDVKTVSYRPRSDLYYWPLAAALLLSVIVRSRNLITERISSHTPRTARLRVNSRTFELETVK